MAQPWISSVREKGELTVYNGLKSGKWVHLSRAALQAFNQFGLPVKLSAANDKQNANVVMETSSGTATFDYEGDTYSGVLDPARLHGLTLLLGRDGRTEKAAIFLPADPKSGPMFRGGKAVYERATLDMMKVIAVHELVHACGLDNRDHATDDGLFYFPLAPSGDGKIIVPAQGKESRPMPPLRLGASTVAKIANLWRS
jgi:hypothetical protein